MWSCGDRKGWGWEVQEMGTRQEGGADGGGEPDVRHTAMGGRGLEGDRNPLSAPSTC